MMHGPIHVYLSDRGIPLLWWQRPQPTRTVLTMENYCKWYHLHFINTDGDVTELHFGVLEHAAPNVSPPFVDHVPNPEAVRLYAAKYNIYVDESAYEMIVGRWELENEERYLIP
jgi:hypothetical protein